MLLCRVADDDGWCCWLLLLLLLLLAFVYCWLAETTTRDRHFAFRISALCPFGGGIKDVLHKICNPHGQVLRIVIFKKNGVQAMVEFDSLDAATRARENLNGADIYSGCCTLKIDFAKNDSRLRGDGDGGEKRMAG
uniref:PTBP1-like RNA recognition motif 2 domain-containing protein n=1 Tax=Glossina austeni TaxID=7395 RepID=A0A1A9VG92_GLOAU